ncbi:MAG: hypothetical protein JNK15_12515 [Planctomycetes bacterium]|nr:hypothetical protein [Planctomycetota bacterium]
MLHAIAVLAVVLDQSPIAAEPPELLRISLAGPATWRVRMQPTDLGAMLATEPAEKLWRRHVDDLDATLRAVHGADAEFARERARLLDYAGTLHVVTWLEQAEDALHVPRWSAAVVAEPDGHTDLEAMARESEGWLRRVGEQASNAWRELRPGTPRVHAGRLVVVFADDDARVAATARALAWRGKPLDPRDVLRVEGEVGPLLGLLRDRAWERGLAADVLGAATRRFVVTCGAFGPDVAAMVRLQFDAGGDRGVFAGLAPVRTGVPDLQGLVPDETSLRVAWQVDWAAVWNSYCTVLAGVQERSVAATRARLQRTCGDVVQSLVPHLRSDVLLVCGPGDPDDGVVPFARAGLVVALQDQDRVVEALAPVVAAFGARFLPAADGAQVADFGFVQLFVGDGVLVLGSAEHGPGLAAQVRSRIAETGVPPAKFADAGAGVSGAGTVAVGAFLRGELYAALRLLPMLLGSDGLPTGPTGLVDEVERWTPLLKAHRLDTAALDLRGRTDEIVVRVLW